MPESPTPKRPRGRPPGTGKPLKSPDEERAIRHTISLLPSQIRWLKAHGNSRWVQEQIDKAKSREAQP
jgi:hypothetical protein